MNIKSVSASFFVSDAISVKDLPAIRELGIKTIICNRPDGEQPAQASFKDIEEGAEKLGIVCYYLPTSPKDLDYSIGEHINQRLDETGEPVLAYCRSGLRSISLWSVGQMMKGGRLDTLCLQASHLGYDIKAHLMMYSTIRQNRQSSSVIDVVIVGGGAAGIAAASSLLSRCSDLNIAIVDPAENHYYQPGWTMVGAGVFSPEQTKRRLLDVLPEGVVYHHQAVSLFMPSSSSITLDNGDVLTYKQLVVAAGLKLDWDKIPGLTETLGKNGVTSNYRYDLAPYTWELVRNLKQGEAIFTQPPMPIKCAGAPQKAMYLSADNWLRNDCSKGINIHFYTATPALFGVAYYVPTLMAYIEKYDVSLNVKHNLIKVDGENKMAWFETTTSDEQPTVIEKSFDMLHVCPPQSAPDFIKQSPIADADGWVDVDKQSLRHKRFDNIWGIGDVTNTPNAKTAAAARAQAPVLACNLLASMDKDVTPLNYLGYGSCPLTVELGKVVLAEFGYGGQLMPSFPQWLLDSKKPSSLSWMLKKTILPELYWHGMLKGREWLITNEPDF
jgi:sulfide:quinone oxidoreductase